MHRLWIFVLLIFASTQASVNAQAMKSIFPGKTWEHVSPTDAKMDATQLEKLARYMGGRGCIVRHGRVVFTWGAWDKRGDVASAVKPWYSALLFKAVEMGKLPSLDTPVSDYEPRLKGINAALGHPDADITFRQMANQISCYGLPEAPGSAYAYNDWQMALFLDTLVEKVYGSSLKQIDTDLLRPLLADAIGCEDAPTMLAFGLNNRAGRLAVSPGDFARFGLLFLNNGVWNGDRVLDAQHVRLALRSPLPNSIPRAGNKSAEMIPGQRSIGSTQIPDNQTDHNGSYSWLWWLNGVNREGKRHWPDAPANTFTALGHKNGMRGMAVLPGPQIIMAWNDTTLDRRPSVPHPLGPALRLLMEATKDEPMPGQIVAHPHNKRHLARKENDGSYKPVFLCGPGDPEDFLYRGKRNPDGTRQGDQNAILDKMRGTGANCLYIQSIRSHGGDGDHTHNPFIDSDPKKGLNENILTQWEIWLTRMDDQGIIPLFFIYDDSASIWKTGDTVGPEEAAFLRTFVDRFEHHRNLVWCIAEEYQEAFSPTRVKRMAAIIRQADEHNHAIAVHKLNGLDFEELAGDPNIDQFAIQHNEKSPEALHEGLVRAWSAAQGRYSINLTEAADHGFGPEATAKHWTSAMAGACGAMALGWTFDTPNAPSRADLEACGRIVRFFEATDFQNMVPSDELRSQGTQHVLARRGQSYILYTDSGTAPLGLRNLETGDYWATWHNINTGAETSTPFAQTAEGKMTLSRPGTMQGPIAIYIRREEKKP